MLQEQKIEVNVVQQIKEALYYQDCMFCLEHLIFKTTNVLWKEYLSQMTSNSFNVDQHKENSDCNRIDNMTQEHDIKDTRGNRSPSHSITFAVDRQLVEIKENDINNEEEDEKIKDQSTDDMMLRKKKKRLAMMCTNCPHHEAKHYAKKMCSNCYHSRGRNKKPWNCKHSIKTHYALGLCQNCYQLNYIRNRKDMTDDISQNM